MDFQLQEQAEMLGNKIKHYLITTMGVTLKESNDEEFYRAFCLALREEIMINWTSTSHTFKNNKVRKMHFLCMEYMPGRLLGNNITNINAVDLVRLVMKNLQKDFDKELQKEPDPGLGNGGLGRLAACLLDSLATQQYPAMGYGLRYQYGIFDQEIWNGVQVERPDNWLLHENPWEFRKDDHAVSVRFCGSPVAIKNKKGEEVFDIVNGEEVRALSFDLPIIGYKKAANFNVLTLRLWTTKESPRNFQLQRYNAGQLDQAAENTCLTDVLYPNDNNEVGKRIRLKQEFLLASASLQDIIMHHLKLYSGMAEFGDKIRIQINDTHPALVIAELMRILLKVYDFGWGEAWEVVRACCSYTNHTVLRESLEEWNEHRVVYLLPRQYHIIERLNLEFCNTIRNRYPGDETRVRRMSVIQDGQVRMAHLAILGSHRVNGVAELHTEILKTEIFKDFYEMFPEKFVNVTNGVTQRRWILYDNPGLAEWITKRIGNDWIVDLTKLQALEKYAADPTSQQEFWNVKKKNKEKLIAFFKEKNPIRNKSGAPIGHYEPLSEEALFDVQVKRIHEYKRQLMNALHVLMVYQELVKNPTARKVPRMVIFAGKAAPGYQLAKDVIQFICCLARKINADPKTNALLRVAFIENYNVSRAEVIIPAADLSEQISTAGMEASGTGNMKLSMNGALTICTEDGSTIEMHRAVTDKWWPFSFGKTAAQNAAMRLNRTYNPLEIYIHHGNIKEAIDALRNGFLTENEEEQQALNNLHGALLDGQYAEGPDRYFILSDLQEYYETQKKVEALFENPSKWAEYAIHNMAAMGLFSSDQTVHNYSKLVWNLEPCPVDPKELEIVRIEYSEHDKCRILPRAAS